jgi:uncharacterized NAD(P)/FAD-binding protein YdhS
MTARAVVVGGGAAGTLAAAHLLAGSVSTTRPIEINLVERTGSPCRGVAYGPDAHDYLMNTPIGKVSAFPDDPGHLLRWARGREPHLDSTDFLPRSWYGDYLADTLADAEVKAEGHARLSVVRATATGLRGDRSRGALAVELADGSALDADLVVLATGNPSAVRLGSDRWITDPWTDDLDRLDGAKSVLLVGTGLTMTDVALRVGARSPGTTMVAISRRGLLPHRHGGGCPHGGHGPAVDRILGQDTLRGLTTALRREVRTAPLCWREIVDGLRPHSQSLWEQLTGRERVTFVQRFGRYWDVHRHRLPVPAAAKLDELIAAGRLRVCRGEVIGLSEDGTRLRAEVDSGVTHTDFGVDCTGFVGLPRSADPLWQRLVTTGFARWEPLGMGVEADGLGRLRGEDGIAHPQVVTLGAPLRGTRFETTAIPEIRAQAETLAAHVFGDLVPFRDEKRSLSCVTTGWRP